MEMLPPNLAKKLAAYLQYLTQHKVFEGFLLGDDEAYIAFWPPEQLVSANSDLGMAQRAPGYVAFAGDGGGEVFAISPANKVVRLPMVGLEPAHALEVADSLSELLARIPRI